jgi:AraC-like DNA-binding protein
VPRDERLAYWDNYNAAALIGLRTTSQAVSGLVASQANATLATMRIAEIKGNEHAVERSEGMVGLRPKDAVFAIHLVKGTAFFLQRGMTYTLNAGDTLIYDTRLPFALEFLSDMHELLVDVPVAELDACWGIRADELPLKITPIGGVGMAIGTELRRALKGYLSAPTADAGVSLPACVHTVLRLMVQSHTTGAGALHQSLFHMLAAKTYIAQHLGDAELCPASVARQVGISVRHLNRLFSVEGTSLAEHIWAQRAGMAYRDLVNRSLRLASIGEIAFRWGFSSQAHFSRAITERYGISPSVLRKTANAQPRAIDPRRAGCTPL